MIYVPDWVETTTYEWIECPECNGTGEVETDLKGIDGNICPECDGKGRWQVPV